MIQLVLCRGIYMSLTTRCSYFLTIYVGIVDRYALQVCLLLPGILLMLI